MLTFFLFFCFCLYVIVPHGTVLPPMKSLRIFRLAPTMGVFAHGVGFRKDVESLICKGNFIMTSTWRAITIAITTISPSYGLGQEALMITWCDDNRYMAGYKCKVTGSTSTKTLATAQVPKYCAGNPSQCVQGAKQILVMNRKSLFPFFSPSHSQFPIPHSPYNHIITGDEYIYIHIYIKFQVNVWYTQC